MHKRLRRGSSTGWERPDKHKRHRQSFDNEDYLGPTGRESVNYQGSERGSSIDLLVLTFLTMPVAVSPRSFSHHYNSNSYLSCSHVSAEDLDIQEMEAKLQHAQAELKVAELRLSLISKKRKGLARSKPQSPDPVDEPHVIN